ncbi:MAG: hypothetical protein ACM3SW_03610 [Actinomycetota bacterium]
MKGVTIEQQVVEKLRELPPEKQKEVLVFMESLQGTEATSSPRRSLLGLWEDLNSHITTQDIAEARQAMWGSFPRGLDQ